MHTISYCLNRWEQISFEPLQKSFKAISPALRTLAELGFAWKCTSFVLSCGLASSIPCVQCLIAGAALSVVCKVAFAIFELYRLEEWQAPSFEVERGCALFGIVHAIGLSGLNILIHELGHATAASLCYLRSDIEIVLHPFLGGETSYVNSYGLTTFGKLLGREGAHLLCIAGGVSASSLVATLEMMGAYHLWNEEPRGALLLFLHGCSQLLGDVVYGIETWKMVCGPLTNDFIAMQTLYGVHPIVAVGAMVSVPLIALGLSKAFTFQLNPI